MELSFLETYQSKVRQLGLLRGELKSEYMKEIDSSHIATQSGSDDLKDVFACRSAEMKEKLSWEIEKLMCEIKDIQDYILNIDDFECREIAERRYLKGETYEQIGDAMFMHRTTVRRKLQKYIAHNAH